MQFYKKNMNNDHLQKDIDHLDKKNDQIRVCNPLIFNNLFTFKTCFFHLFLTSLSLKLLH